jgi:uncharacterized membrane protein YidH (DUF202 family)
MQGVGVFIWYRLSIEALLSGGVWLATLKVHALINGLQSSDRIGIVKKHVKRRSGGAWSCTESALGDSGSISRFDQRKVHRKLVNRHAGQLIGSCRHIIWIHIVFVLLLTRHNH